MATSGRLPLNYKAAVLKPKPPEPEVAILAPEWTNPYSPLKDDCIGHVELHRFNQMDVPIFRPVVEFEDEELKQYQTQKGVFYKKFRNDLEWLAKKTGKNIIGFVGHVEQLNDVVRGLEYTLHLKRPEDIQMFNPKLETIMVCVACYSGDNAYDFNYSIQNYIHSFPNLKKLQFTFLGFDNLVHIYRGDIYVCEKSQTRMESFQCVYPEAHDDKKTVFQNINNDKWNRLETCCQSKFDRFKSMFVDDLSTRNCGKITKEIILNYIQNLLAPNGKIDGTKTTRKPNVSISFADGKVCPSADCQPVNPYKGAERTAASFDKAGELMLLGVDLLNYAVNEPEDKLLNKIQSLKPEQRKVLYMRNYMLEGGNVLFDLLFYKKYKTILYCFKNYSIPITFIGDTRSTFFSYAADITSSTQEDKLFELFHALYKSSDMVDYSKGYVLRQYDERNYNSLYYMIFNRRKLLLEFYLYFLDHYTFVNYADANLAWRPTLYIACERFWFDPSVWKLLFSFGADPTLLYNPSQTNRNTSLGETVVQYILNYIPPPFPKDILQLCCIFGYQETSHFEEAKKDLEEALADKDGERFEFYKDNAIRSLEVTKDTLRYMSANDVEYFGSTQLRIMLERMNSNLEATLKEAVATLETCLRIIRSSPERKRKLRSKIMGESLEALNQTMKTRIATLETRNTLPALYGKLNKTLKRANVKLRPNEKKSLRNKGLKVLRNNTRNPINRAGNLQDMIDSALGEKPTVKANNNFVGGRKTRRQKH